MHETQQNVPKVLVECITKLESRSIYMQQLGLYRASGNHATIQNIRFKVFYEDTILSRATHS